MKESTRTVKALLFSDVKGFSKMSERDCLLFCRNFHSGVQKDVLSRYEESIILQNTWGDALHVVMDDLTKAGNLALDLRDWMEQFDWRGVGMSFDLKIRIALHAGVVTKVPGGAIIDLLLVRNQVIDLLDVTLEVTVVLECLILCHDGLRILV